MKYLSGIRSRTLRQECRAGMAGLRKRFQASFRRKAQNSRLFSLQLKHIENT